MNTNRISGISSGMDTETMIRDLMKIERSKVDKLSQEKQTSLWRQEQYNTVNKDFANFILDTKKELELTKTTSSGIMLNNSVSNVSWIKKGTSSDEDIFTVKTTSTAMTGNHKVRVKNLAEGVNIVGQSAVKLASDPSKQATKATKLSELGLTDGSISFEIDVNGVARTVNVAYEAGDTIDKLVKKINSATTDDGKNSLGIQANFDETSGRLFMATRKTGSDAKIKVTADANGVLTGKDSKFHMDELSRLGKNVTSAGEVKVIATGATKLSKLGVTGIDTYSIKLKVGGSEEKEITFKNDTTIQDLINDFALELGITASFDDGKLKLDAGDNEIVVTEDKQGLLTGESNKFNMTGSTTLGKSATSASEVKSAVATGATQLSELGIDDGDHSITLKLVDKDGTENLITVEFNANDKIEDNAPQLGLIQKINKAVEVEDEGLDNNIVSFSEGKLIFDTKDIIGDKEIIVEEDKQGLFTGTNKFMVGEKTGIDAKIDFDGAKDLEYSSNTIMINGIQMDLKAVPAKTDEVFTLKVDTDVNSVYDKIKTFVDKYNEFIGKMNTKVSEKRYRQYTPLTSEQKESMKEDDVKLWEQKAKSGLLRNDEFLSRTMQTMRSGLYEKVDGVVGNYNQLAIMGITTGKWEEKGKLVINERKLKDAIKDDVDGVMDLLFKEPSSVTDIDEKIKEDIGEDKYNNLTNREKESYRNTEIRSETGIVNRLFGDMVGGMKEIINKAGPGGDKELYRDVQRDILIDFITGGNGRKGSISMLDDDVLGYDKRIRNEENRLAGIEERYWSKFTAMEKVLSQMESQSSWIAQQMGGM